MKESWSELDLTDSGDIFLVRHITPHPHAPLQ